MGVRLAARAIVPVKGTDRVIGRPITAAHARRATTTRGLPATTRGRRATRAADRKDKAGVAGDRLVAVAAAVAIARPEVVEVEVEVVVAAADVQAVDRSRVRGQ
ncbi:hypothetical protein PSP6_390064 [Paraburkholderia tropica]|nr:hypothetical protein PSP6_390064 [Paraburkholderia tropica]